MKPTWGRQNVVRVIRSRYRLARPLGSALSGILEVHLEESVVCLKLLLLRISWLQVKVSMKTMSFLDQEDCRNQKYNA